MKFFNLTAIFILVNGLSSASAQSTNGFDSTLLATRGLKQTLGSVGRFTKGVVKGTAKGLPGFAKTVAKSTIGGASMGAMGGPAGMGAGAASGAAAGALGGAGKLFRSAMDGGRKASKRK